MAGTNRRLLIFLAGFDPSLTLRRHNQTFFTASHLSRQCGPFAELKVLSSPSRPIHRSWRWLASQRAWHSTHIVSTERGLLLAREAVARRVGGLVLCRLRF
jgi:ribosomal protein S8